MRVAAIRGLARLKHDAESEADPPRRLVQPQGSLRRTHAPRLRGLVDLEGQGCRRAAGLGPETPRRQAYAWPPRPSSSCWNSPAPRPASSPPSIPGTASRGTFDRPRSAPSTAWPRTTRRSRTWSSPWSTIPIASVRFRAWGLARSLNLKKALPALEARLGQRELRIHGLHRLRRQSAPGDDQRPEGFRAEGHGSRNPPIRPSRSRIWRSKPKSSRSGPGTCASGSRP